MDTSNLKRTIASKLTVTEMILHDMRIQNGKLRSENWQLTYANRMLRRWMCAAFVAGALAAGVFTALTAPWKFL